MYLVYLDTLENTVLCQSAKALDSPRQPTGNLKILFPRQNIIRKKRRKKKKGNF